MIMGSHDSWARAGSTLASLMFVWAVVDKFIPGSVKTSVARYIGKLTAFFNPYNHITIAEYTGEFSMRNEAYLAVEAYLTANSSHQAKNLQAEISRPSQKLSLTIDVHQEVVDAFQGAKLWWYAGKTQKSNSFSLCFHPDREEKRFYRLTFHARHRKLVTEVYLPHVVSQGKSIRSKNRRKKLFTNNADNLEYTGRRWSSVAFDHPATFETLAMDPVAKKTVMDDLASFCKRKDYYGKIGRAWKRGYLLYGPPGTGKSSMIAATANLLNYDVYDLELTAVKDNTELRKLLFDIGSRSIIVIEDIDCSLDLASKRAEQDPKDKAESSKTPVVVTGTKKKQSSKVTLSGLLNFIDGLWSACGGERIIVFTTNHIEKLDPALIRRGRMDMHIELSFCSFEGFKILAKNYLSIESHALYERIGELLKEVLITPADVAENLMPKSAAVDVDACLQNFISVLLCKARMEITRAEKATEEVVSDGNEAGENIESDENEAAENIDSDENENAAGFENEESMETPTGSESILCL